MNRTVRVTIRVRKYLWSEFVHDACYVLYATIIISNALCKRYLKRSLRQLLQLTRRAIKWGFWITIVGIWSYFFIASALGWR
jgi:hypothetical protein